jgi:8-hydroxy-5-deazaflavin:NADPH oxidoreductase
MKIGIIGSGHVGSSVAALLVKGGHEVRFGAREPRDDASLPGPIGTIAQAAAFGNVVLCATPYGVWPQLARELAPLVKGKVVIDAANPYPQRDGAFAQSAIDAGEGSGVPIAKLLPVNGLAVACNTRLRVLLRSAKRSARRKISCGITSEIAAFFEPA